MNARPLIAAILSAWCVVAAGQQAPSEETCIIMLAEAADRADKAARFYRMGLGEDGRQAASQARSLERQAVECRTSAEPLSRAAEVVWNEQRELYDSNTAVLAAVVKAIIESRE